MNLANFHPAAENRVFAGDEACLSSILKIRAGTVRFIPNCCREREFSRSEHFLAGEMRAVLREHASAGPANLRLSTSEKIDRGINKKSHIPAGFFALYYKL